MLIGSASLQAGRQEAGRCCSHTTSNASRTSTACELSSCCTPEVLIAVEWEMFFPFPSPSTNLYLNVLLVVVSFQGEFFQ